MKVTTLKSTGEQVHLIPWIGIGARPWPDKYERVLFPAKGRHGARTQMVRKTKLATVKVATL